MQPMIGSKLKEKHAAKWLAAVTPHLHPGEAVTAITRTNAMRPLADGIVVTNARVFTFLSGDVAAKGAATEVAAHDIAQAEVTKRFASKALIVTRRDGETVGLGAIPDPDLETILGVVRQLAQSGAAPDVQAAMANQAGRAQQSRAAWAGVRVVGTAPNQSTWKVLRDHCAQGEVP